MSLPIAPIPLRHSASAPSPTVQTEDPLPSPTDDAPTPPYLLSTQEDSLPHFHVTRAGAKHPSPRVPMTYSQVRAMVGQQILPMHRLEAEICTKNTFCQDVHRLFTTYLHEYDFKCPFSDRLGAFGYREIAGSGQEMVQRFDALSRQPSLRTCSEIRQFLKRNAHFLSHELENLALTQNGKIGVFRQVLVDCAYLTQIMKKGGEADPDKLNQILVSLRRLQTEQDKNLRLIQERIRELEPIMMRKKRNGSNTSGTLELMDLGGRGFSLTPTTLQEKNACVKALTFYDAYIDKILDPTFFYCSKFLSAIVRCRSDLLEFRRSHSISHQAADTADSTPTPQKTDPS